MLTVALDVGGTKVAGGLVDADGRVLARERTSSAGADLTGRVARLARTLVDRAGGTVAGVGLSVAGAVEPATGVVTFAPNLPSWNGVAVGPELSAALGGLPVVLGYDGHAGALGEHWRGAGRGARSLAFLIIGTGVGGGLVLDGRLHLGAHRIAGAAGWMVTDPAQTRTPEGRARGGLESVAAGPAIAAAAGLADARAVAAAAAQGHPAAVAAVDRAAAAVGHAAVGIVSLLDVDAVVLGGGVGAGIPAFAERTRAAVAELAQPQARKGVRVLPAQLGDDAFLVGAARLVLDGRQRPG